MRLPCRPRLRTRSPRAPHPKYRAATHVANRRAQLPDCADELKSRCDCLALVDKHRYAACYGTFGTMSAPPQRAHRFPPAAAQDTRRPFHGAGNLDARGYKAPRFAPLLNCSAMVKHGRQKRRLLKPALVRRIVAGR
jgi:hypothetical protein